MVTSSSLATHGGGAPLTIDDRCPDVVVLLFVRHIWGLEASGLPTVDPAPAGRSDGTPAPSDLPLWSARWRKIWQSFHRCEDDRDRFGSVWQDRFGDFGIDLDALHEWRSSLASWPPPPLRKSPEWLTSEAVSSAQGRGLSRVLIYPSSASWFEARDHGVLLISRGARADPRAYAEALAAFGRRADQPIR